MNISLYEEITSKLNALTGDEVKPENLRTLMGQWSNRAYPADMVSVLCAFYNYMDGKPEYSFIHSVPAWDDFFRQRFANYFTIDTIKTDFDSIIFNDRIVNIILSFTPEAVQKNFYEYAAEVNSLGKENGVNVYEEPFNKLEAKLVEKGLIDKTIKQEKTETSVNGEFSEDKGTEISVAQIEPLQEDKAFSGAAANYLGLSVDEMKSEKAGLDDIIKESGTQPEQTIADSASDVITEPSVSEKRFATVAELSAEIRRLEAEKKAHRDAAFDAAASYVGLSSEDLIKKVGNEQSFDIDGINIDSVTRDKLTSKDAKIASLPNNIFKKIATKVNKRKKLKQMGIEVVNDNNITMLNIVKKDTVFDKIATTSKNVLNNIKKGAQIAGSVALGGIIVGAIAIDEVVKIVKNAGGVISKNISSAKASLSSKTAEGLRSIADRLSPEPDILLQSEQPTQVIDISGPKVILTAGTQVGKIPQKQNSMVK